MRDKTATFYLMLRQTLDKCGINQREASEYLDVSLSLVECWLCHPSKSWHIEPSKIERYGVLHILNAVASNRKYRERHKQRLAATQKEYNRQYYLLKKSQSKKMEPS